jgi:transposase
MKALSISDAEEMILALQDEIRRSDQSRYDHRLHGVLLVAQGMSCPAVARLLGDGPRTVEYWVNRFEQTGFGGLAEGERSGRPSRLNARQLEQVNAWLRQSPQQCGVDANLWDGKTLSASIEQKFQIQLGSRQCQRLFRQLGFRLRKPRPVVGHPDPALQRTHKKTPRIGGKKRR